MSYSRYQFFPEIWDETVQHNHKGIVNLNELKESLLKDNIELYKIPLSYRYRPDLISQHFYGTGDLHWVLSYVNDINNSPEGYEVDTVIRIPNQKRIFEII